MSEVSASGQRLLSRLLINLISLKLGEFPSLVTAAQEETDPSPHGPALFDQFG